ncbi:MAG: flavohemoglobin expression-modulating QEGLA motif protein [Cyanobacteriota bacterium]
MHKLKIEEIIQKIQNNETFTAISDDHSFSISIEAYVPYICVAIHNGGNLRQELRNKIALNKMERWLEEDPLTGNLISSLPIKIISYDSRYEYDLNRSPEECIYNEAWGKQVWKLSLTEQDKAISIKKYTAFYSVLDALIENLINKFEATVVYDIHSFNHQRDGRYENAPTINIGTENINYDKYEKFIKRWISELTKIHVDSVNLTVKENIVFYGRGYLLKYLTQKYNNVLVLATEFKKIYIDEFSGDEYPEVIEHLQKGLKEAIINHAAYFARNFTNMVFEKKYQLLSSGFGDSLKLVDNELYKMLKDVEVLEYLNPINVESEKRKFIKSKYKIIPRFRYKPLPFDTNEIKRSLYKLPIEKIKDIHLKTLYEEIIDDHADKIELLALRGQQDFLYCSLKNYGEPDQLDIDNALFLLHCYTGDVKDELITTEEVSKIIKEDIKSYGFKCNIELVKNLVSGAMVVPPTKTLKLRKDTLFPRTVAKGLAHHEIGIHMLTTINANLQPLKFPRLGMPNRTITQEGLAILSEYLSANINILRLQTLALRVIAINNMLKGYDFIDTFNMLKDIYKMDDDQGFYLATRVYRGGGFTKDYLYLKGFKLMYNHYISGKDINKLLIGKCSLSHINILEELVARDILYPPTYIPSIFKNPKIADEKLNYIVKSLK